MAVSSESEMDVLVELVDDMLVDLRLLEDHRG